MSITYTYHRLWYVFDRSIAFYMLLNCFKCSAISNTAIKLFGRMLVRWHSIKFSLFSLKHYFFRYTQKVLILPPPNISLFVCVEKFLNKVCGNKYWIENSSNRITSDYEKCLWLGLKHGYVCSPWHLMQTGRLSEFNWILSRKLQRSERQTQFGALCCIRLHPVALLLMAPGGSCGWRESLKTFPASNCVCGWPVHLASKV